MIAHADSHSTTGQVIIWAIVVAAAIFAIGSSLLIADRIRGRSGDDESIG